MPKPQQSHPQSAPTQGAHATVRGSKFVTRFRSIVPRLLLINPNTTESVTRLLADAAADRLSNSVQVTAVTAPFGASYITGEHSLAIAAHATLQARQEAIAAHGAFDACLIGCFGDPALQALEELALEPVTGLAEASMRWAARSGDFAIVTGGHGWREPLRRLAFSIGLLDALVALETVDASGAQLKADPDWALRLLGQACHAAIERGKAAGRAPQSVIIGGAGLFGYARALEPSVSVPLLDSVLCGLDLAAERLVKPH
jgi:Asp/Glu/hydantoin racemase